MWLIQRGNDNIFSVAHEWPALHFFLIIIFSGYFSALLAAMRNACFVKVDIYVMGRGYYNK